MVMQARQEGRKARKFERRASSPAKITCNKENDRSLTASGLSFVWLAGFDSILIIPQQSSATSLADGWPIVRFGSCMNPGGSEASLWLFVHPKTIPYLGMARRMNTCFGDWSWDWCLGTACCRARLKCAGVWTIYAVLMAGPQ